jgi:hypothetical protein
MKRKTWERSVHQIITGNENCTISTIVNGAISDNSEKYNDFFKNNITALKQSIYEKNSDNNASATKHRIILIGDSHFRGYGCELTSLLGKNYEIHNVVKAGSSTSKLINSAKAEISKLSCEDLIVIGRGTNDYDLNEFSLVCRYIFNFLQLNKHTKVAVMNIPFRHDLANSDLVNSCINKLNKKIKKTIKAFPHANMLGIDNSNKLFTNHGLQRNKLGKRSATHSLALFIQSFFEQKTQIPITLGWHNEVHDTSTLRRQNEDHDINSFCEDNVANAPTRNSRRNKRIPVTRS